MEILGIGPLELILILLIALIILGPKDMSRLGKTVGRWLYKLTSSPTYKKIINLPSTLMREAGLEELDMVIDPGKRRTIWRADSDQPGKPQAGENIIPSEWISPSAPAGTHTAHHQPGSQPPPEQPGDDQPPAQEEES